MDGQEIRVMLMRAGWNSSDLRYADKFIGVPRSVENIQRLELGTKKPQIASSVEANLDWFHYIWFVRSD